MNENIKDSLYGLAGIGFIILIIGAFVLLVTGGARLFEIIYPTLEIISGVVWGVMLLLVFLSVVPRFRDITGNGIVIGTYIVGAILWLLSFYTTYILWGFLGIFIGVMLMGFGVFLTAILALIFDGQGQAAFYFIFILVQIYLFRMLGHWILTKYRPGNKLKK